MSKFVPEDTPKEPLLIRRAGQVYLLTNYKIDKDGRAIPITGFEVTDAYERQRGRDAVRGVPLIGEYIKTKSAGEILYAGIASEHEDLQNVSWEDLDDDQRTLYNKIGAHMFRYFDGEDTPLMY